MEKAFELDKNLKQEKMQNKMFQLKMEAAVKPTPEIYSEIADLYFNEKYYKEAYRDYSKSAQLGSKSGTVYFNLGLIDMDYSDKPNNEAAIKNLSKALTMLTNTMDKKSAYENLGLAYERKKDLQNAIVNYKKGAELEPNYAQSIYCKLANVYEKLKDGVNAAKYKRMCY